MALEDVCACGALEPMSREFPARESRLWLVRHGRRLGVLRRLVPGLFPVDAGWVEQDLAWLHSYLARLSASFPAPAPLPVFEGVSWTRSDDAWWDVVSYLPGEPIGWRPKPSLEEVGHLLAAMHQANASVGMDHQRPRAVPLTAVVAADAPGPLGEWIERLSEELALIGHDHAPRSVIHGDFTAHNVLAFGDPPQVSGVIDFALAHREDPRADIAYGLWRSGRPRQDAIEMDLDRVSLFVRGYHRTSHLAPTDADAIVVYLWARGVQSAVRQWRRTRQQPHEDVSRRVAWLIEHQPVIRRRIYREVSRS
jgi:Ser/Thr protein kinase RdoA (MazF antagonist)